MEKKRKSYFWLSPDGAQQLGAVTDSGGSVNQISGEFGRLREVMLLEFKRLVFNTWKIENTLQLT